MVSGPVVPSISMALDMGNGLVKRNNANITHMNPFDRIAEICFLQNSF
jgi:hypothetical protein